MTEAVSFETAEIPGTEDIPPIDSGEELYCQVCGKPITYSGRGRKPKFCNEHRTNSSSVKQSTTARSGGRDVNAAMAALSGGHTALQFALSLVSMNAAATFEAGRADLDARNRAILEADPALAKRLAQAASKGGGVTLVISHAICVGPALAVAMSETRARAAARREAESADPTLFGES